MAACPFCLKLSYLKPFKSCKFLWTNFNNYQTSFLFFCGEKKRKEIEGWELNEE